MNEFDDKTRMMLSKAIEDLVKMQKFQEEFLGLLHQMVLELYNRADFNISDDFLNYKFKNKNPWGESE